MNQVFKVVSFNIQHGSWTSFDWNRLVLPIREVGADLVGMQEVDMFTSRTNGADSVTGIRTALGWGESRFVRSMPYAGGEYGNAMFAREDFVSFEAILLPNADGQEPRSCGHAVLSLDNGRRLHFLNTHLAYESAASRKPQFEVLRGILDAIPQDEPFVLTGDFNTEHAEAFAPLLCGGRAALTNDLSPDRPPHSPHYKTFPGSGHAIDNVVYDNRNLSICSSGMLEGKLSDHNMLWAEFRLK